MDGGGISGLSGEKMDEDRLEDFAGVFSLIDRQGAGYNLGFTGSL